MANRDLASVIAPLPQLALGRSDVEREAARLLHDYYGPNAAWAAGDRLTVLAQLVELRIVRSRDVALTFMELAAPEW